MPRFFNTTGPCRPDDHFMLPTEPRLPEVRPLIEKKLYFVLHAPRQSGKTTCFQALARTLTAEGTYAAVHASCERGQVAGSDVERGIQAVLRAIELQTEKLPEDLRPP
ncbi:MAG TPA: ATP-binding protein, partial [Thermoanaerobaculia bacterium]